jgi:hypothetical protein
VFWHGYNGHGERNDYNRATHSAFQLLGFNRCNRIENNIGVLTNVNISSINKQVKKNKMQTIN